MGVCRATPLKNQGGVLNFTELERITRLHPDCTLSPGKESQTCGSTLTNTTTEKRQAHREPDINSGTVPENFLGEKNLNHTSDDQT